MVCGCYELWLTRRHAIGIEPPIHPAPVLVHTHNLTDSRTFLRLLNKRRVSMLSLSFRRFLWLFSH